MQDVKLQFDEATHTYTVNGRVVPHVTACIDWLNNYAGVPADVLERARERGTNVHLATALYDRDDLDETSVDPEVRPYLDAWIQFRRDTGAEIELVEHRMYSPALDCAGTLDRVLERTMLAPALIDIKSGQWMPGEGPQTAAYKQMLVDTGYPGALGLARYTLRLVPGKTPPYRLEAHRDSHDLTVFRCSLTLHNWRAKNRIK